MAAVEVQPDYAAPWWLSSAHLQTVWGRLFRSRRAVRTRRENVTTPDGDEVVLDELLGDSDHPRAILLHGLEGSSNSVYIQGILELLEHYGAPATVINFRSCARSLSSVSESIPNRGRRLYHSGETSDLDFVVRLLRSREPQRELVGFGASLGGNVLLKWLGERGSESELSRAATLSVPYDLAAGSRHLERGAGPYYVRGFLRSLLRKGEGLSSLHSDLPQNIDLEKARRAKTFYDFDDAITAPLHGFESADDYYRQSSSLHYLHRIAIPTLCINAADDPFLPAEVLSAARALASSHVEMMVTTRGGHVGFVAGSPLRPRYWGEEKVVSFLLDKRSEKNSARRA